MNWSQVWNKLVLSDCQGNLLLNCVFYNLQLRLNSGEENKREKSEGKSRMFYEICNLIRSKLTEIELMLLYLI